MQQIFSADQHPSSCVWPDAHAHDSHYERNKHDPCDNPFEVNHANQNTTKTLVVRRVVDRFVTAFDSAYVGQQLDAEIRREHDSDDP